MNNTLAKLTIYPEWPSDLKGYPKSIAVQFNPASYSINQTTVWQEQGVTDQNPRGIRRDLNAPPLNFAGGNSRTLTMELLFDVTEEESSADVRNEMATIIGLCDIPPTKIGNKKHPPICTFKWGGDIPYNKRPLKGVIESCTQNFTLFRSNGVPLRATMSLTIKEHLEPDQDQRQTDPDLTTYTVKRGDTLSSIAFAMYQDPSLWRLIATANKLEDPRHLIIGSGLTIPALS